MNARRLVRRALAQLPFLTCFVLLLAAVVYLLAEPGHWRRGTAAIAIAPLLAGLFRLVLPAGRVGLLRSRARWIDVAFFWAFGVLVLIVDIQLG